MNRHRTQGFLGVRNPLRLGFSKGLVPPWPRVGQRSRPRRANVDPCQRQWNDIASNALFVFNVNKPVVYIDESPQQLIKETWRMAPAEQGCLDRHDYEYEHCGVSNIFMAGEPLAGHRLVQVMEQRTKKD